MNLEKKEVQLLLVLTGVTPFLSLLCAYYAKEFWRRRNLFGFSGRKGHLTMYSIYFTLIWMATRVFACWLEYYGTYDEERWTSKLASASNSCVRSACFFGSMLFLVLRVWLVFFDVNLAVANSDQQWISLITQPVAYIPTVCLVGNALCGFLRGDCSAARY